MPRLPSTEITRYLVRLDDFLTRPVRMVVIGGFAIALGWNAKHSTSDIDVLGQLDPDLVSAIKAAGAEGAVPIQSVSISSQPESFEDRLRRLELPDLRYLSIVLPEAHDLAIMKIARGLTHDLEGIEEIHAEQPLDLGTLVARFRETDYIGRQSDFRWAFLAAISRLFGETLAEELERTL